VVVVRVAPFDFVGLPHGFGWLPFQSLMNGSTAQLVRGIFSDAFLYGGLIWLLTVAGLRLGLATALTAALLLGLSVAQTFQPGPPGEITDAVIALAVGGVLALLREDGAEQSRAG
jgi:hypothetical protein